jgi:hypothetical protein
MANAYGATGNLDAIPDNLKWGADGKPLVDQSFRPGGQFAGTGGAWLNNPPPQPGRQQGAPATVSSPEDVAKLPHGTPFIIPSGPNQGKTGYAQ